MKRIGTVDDVAPVVAFLASPEAAWVNGQNILVNGVSACVLFRGGGANFVVDARVPPSDRVAKNESSIVVVVADVQSKNDACP